MNKWSLQSNWSISKRNINRCNMEWVWNVTPQFRFRSFCDQTSAPSIFLYINWEKWFLHNDWMWSEMYSLDKTIKFSNDVQIVKSYSFYFADGVHLQFLFFSAFAPINGSNNRMAMIQKCDEQSLYSLRSAGINVPGPQKFTTNILLMFFFFLLSSFSYIHCAIGTWTLKQKK